MSLDHMVIRRRWDEDSSADKYESILSFGMDDDIDIANSIDTSLIEPEDILYVCDMANISSLHDLSDEIYVVDENNEILPVYEQILQRWEQPDKKAEELIGMASSSDVDKNLILLALCDMCRWLMAQHERYRNIRDAEDIISDVEAYALGKRNSMDLGVWSMVTNEEDFGWQELHSLVRFALYPNNNPLWIARNLDAESRGLSLYSRGAILSTTAPMREIVRSRIPTRKFVLADTKMDIIYAISV